MMNPSHQVIEVNDEKVRLKVSDILILDDIHLNCKSLYLGNAFKHINRARRVEGNVFVQAIENGKYKLIMGLKPLAMAKILDIEEIDVIITNKNHKELVEELNINENTGQ